MIKLTMSSFLAINSFYLQFSTPNPPANRPVLLSQTPVVPTPTIKNLKSRQNLRYFLNEKNNRSAF